MKPKQTRSCPPTKRASALLLTTILLFVVLSMVVSLTYVTVMEQKMSQKTKSSVGSFYTAESGIEWALNQISTGSGNTIGSKFAAQATNATAEGKISCPFSSDCNIYLLDSSGNVIPKAQFTNPDSADLVKAVRSVGAQGTQTQRAIEAAVAAGGEGITGGCSESSFNILMRWGNGCKASGSAINGSNFCTDVNESGYICGPSGWVPANQIFCICVKN